jgi:2Fe-2S ferredoxin
VTKIIFQNADGSQFEVEAAEGTSIMQAAVDNGIDGILAECGGACSCATCHCYIDENYLDKIPAAGDVEQSMIEFAMDPQDNSRLSCQVQITADLDGMVVKLPASQY